VDRSAALTVRYRCALCPQDFGDPEAERSFELWAAFVSAHMLDHHNKLPYYLNDMVKPVWEWAKAFA
jgi:hypothetical protein